MGDMLRLRYLALLAAAACSPVKDASNVPDAPIDSTDMRPPMIASSVPEDMANKVSILSPISVFFDEALDPASVSAATVKLGYRQPNPKLIMPSFFLEDPHGPVPAGLTPIAGTVSYDEAAKKVSFVPALPLPYGYVFTLSLDVKDHAGLAFTGEVHFMTYVNANTRQFFFDPALKPTSWLGFPTDMAGWPTKQIGGSAPGNDTIWFTADDPRDQHYGFSYAPDGRILEERAFNSGSDGKYDTSDDTQTLCIKYFYDATQTLKERAFSTAIGPDNMWCTNDDVPTYNWVYAYDAGTLTGFSIDTDPGADNTWHTTDDVCAVYYDYEYDAQGRKAREIYHGCGGDGLAHTADDDYIWYYQYEYDAGGNLARKTYFTGPGADTLWLTGDDSPSNMDRYTRNGDGQVTDTRTSNGSGTDGVWGTDDDAGTRVTQSYNAQKLVEETTSYNAVGTDGVWGTDDDVIESYHKLTYDVNGNRIDEKQYAAGTDGMWKTDDDRVTVDYDFELGK